MHLVEGVAPHIDDVVRPSERIKNELGWESSKNFIKGMYVIVEHKEELFPGEIIEFIEEGVKVSCMDNCGLVGSTRKWPKKMNGNLLSLL